jgi:predicted porin
MKKSLFAVAAVTAFAGAAQAQSSVTVYGIMDAGYVGGNTRVASGTAVGKQTVSQFNSSAESTSRLGFKGTEDLGGGMSAFFTIELGLAPADSTSGFKNSSTTQNRQSFVGLKKNGLGDFAVGTQYTVVHNAVSATDAAGTNNILGDMIYTSATGVAAGATNTASSEGYGNGQSYTIRTQNTLTVNTDSFAGFKGHAMAVLNNKNNTQSTLSGGNGYTGGTNNQNGWGLGVDYTLQGLYATVAYQAFSAKEAYDLTAITTYGATGTKTAAGTPGYVAFGEGQASALGNNTKDNQFYAAATYDFGILKAYAQYLNRKVSSQLDSGYFLKRTGQQLGVKSYITPTIEAWAQAGMGKYTAFAVPGPTVNNPAANLTSWQIGSNYWLSKRTNLYAIYGQVGK